MKRKYPEIVDTFFEKLNGKAGECRDLMEQFKTCYTNTLENTVLRNEDGTCHVITGDIPAMWLRDSAAQVRPYLYIADRDEEIRDMIAGLVKRQFFYLSIDPYANAFNNEPNGACWEKDSDDQSPWVWERKYELDSLCYPVQLAYLLWKNTGCTTQFDHNFRSGVKKILEIMKTEQNHETESDYRFVRTGSFFTDTLSRDGKGALTRPGTGLIWSGFRPSDDACTYGYLIPSNMFAVVILGYMAEIAEEILQDETLGKEAAELRETVHAAIEKYGKTRTEEFGEIYAYETDGYGMYNLMDDANVPSLLSMTYLGYPADPETAANTRRFILSEANPYYFKGSEAKGIGSPHTPSSYIWHIALAMQGLTEVTTEAQFELLSTLARTTGGKGMMHEGFHVDNPGKYTREWFSWANAMYCELFLVYLGYSIKK